MPVHQVAAGSTTPPRPNLPMTDELTKTAALEEDPEDDGDRELLAEFVAESRENLGAAEQSLLLLEDDPYDEEAIGSVFRAFHTVKGISAFLDLKEINRLAHATENLLSRIRDGEVRCVGGYAALCFHSVDMLSEMIEGVKARLEGDALPPPPSGLGTHLEALSDPEGHGVSEQAGSAGAARHAGETASARTGRRGAEESESFVRLRTDRLDMLLDAVGELVIAQTMVAQDKTLVGVENLELQRKVAHAGKIVRELQHQSMGLRLIPLKAAFQKMKRVVRDVASNSAKQVQLVTEGEETEIDRSVVDVLAEPLVHMVRNACDHGVEGPEERARAGKPTLGRITLRAFNEGGHVVVEIADDGRGLDASRIRQKAIERGLLEPGVALPEEETLALVFEPGFSTAEKVTDVSGRGVGMDVVKRQVDRLKGRVRIRSELGEGTTFSIHVPLTLAITDGMVVRVAEERYILPTLSITMSLRPEAQDIFAVAGRGEVVMVRGKPIPLIRLHALFETQGAIEDPTQALIVVTETALGRAALLVDGLVGQYQVVTKSLEATVGEIE
ncbi:MAG: chemotaxis protein CheA, partial [Myxococcales bacterium]|nr:chemotaxis protein CheA [Myxococcales bacterium]